MSRQFDNIINADPQDIYSELQIEISYRKHLEEKLENIAALCKEHEKNPDGGTYAKILDIAEPQATPSKSIGDGGIFDFDADDIPW